jgi:hypothetical protein
MLLTAKDLAYLRDCACRYAPQDTDIFEADVFDGMRAGLHLGDAIDACLGEPLAVFDRDVLGRFKRSSQHGFC